MAYPIYIVKRICKVCGKPLIDGMYNDDRDYIHEDCFKKYMDDLYGEGNWKHTEDGEEDGCGGYYLVTSDGGKTWEGTGIYWTEWYDDWYWEQEDVIGVMADWLAQFGKESVGNEQIW